MIGSAQSMRNDDLFWRTHWSNGWHSILTSCLRIASGSFEIGRVMDLCILRETLRRSMQHVRLDQASSVRNVIYEAIGAARH